MTEHVDVPVEWLYLVRCGECGFVGGADDGCCAKCGYDGVDPASEGIEVIRTGLSEDERKAVEWALQNGISALKTEANSYPEPATSNRGHLERGRDKLIPLLTNAVAAPAIRAQERERVRAELGVLAMMLRENQRHEEGERNRYDEKGERTHPRRLMHDGKAAAYRNAEANLALIIANLDSNTPVEQVSDDLTIRLTREEAEAIAVDVGAMRPSDSCFERGMAPWALHSAACDKLRQALDSSTEPPESDEPDENGVTEADRAVVEDYERHVKAPTEPRCEGEGKLYVSGSGNPYDEDPLVERDCSGCPDCKPTEAEHG